MKLKRFMKKLKRVRKKLKHSRFMCVFSHKWDVWAWNGKCKRCNITVPDYVAKIRSVG